MQVLTLTVTGLKSHGDAILANDTLRVAANDLSAVVEVNRTTGIVTVRTDNESVSREDLVAAIKHVRFGAK